MKYKLKNLFIEKRFFVMLSLALLGRIARFSKGKSDTSYTLISGKEQFLSLSPM